MKTERRSFLKMLAAVPVFGLLFDATPRPMLESSRVEPAAGRITFPEAPRAWGNVVALSDLKEAPGFPDGLLFFDLSGATLYQWNAERGEWLKLTDPTTFRK